MPDDGDGGAQAPARRARIAQGDRTTATRTLRLVGAALALALVGGACGSDDGGDAGGDAETVDERSDGLTDVTVDADGDPVAGGSIVYGIEAETDGWNPVTSRWAISGHLVGLTLFDTLAAYDADGVAQPYLAESFSSSDDGTVWTIGVREGVTFHDGTRCDAAAIVKVLELMRTSLLTQGALAPVTSVEAVDDRTIEVTMSTPWFSFPAVLTTQVGYVPAPAQLDAPGDASSTSPIGTGPFAFDTWTPDVETIVTRNEDYWREGLPYLDQITFQPIVDASSRLSALTAGDVDVIHSATAESVAEMAALASDGSIQLIVDPSEQEETFLMPNHRKAPFDDPRARLAVAHAIDRDEYVEVLGAGVVEVANGPFVPDSPWAADVEAPAYDVEEATALVEAYEAENGPLTFTLLAATDPSTRRSAELLISQLEAVGIEAEASYTDQTTQIGQVVAGEYDITLWRQFAAPDPDADYIWWHSKGTEGGGIDLNLAGIDDPEIDAALDEGRGTADTEVRREAYARMQALMNENANYIWLQHTQWAIGTNLRVQDIANGPLPDGEPSLPFGAQVSGVHRLTQTWVTP